MTGEMFEDSSKPLRVFIAPPTREVSPVLADSEPLKSFARPPIPKFSVGEPNSLMLPPEMMPAAADFPAFKMIASSEVDVVFRSCARVKSPSKVATLIRPVDEIPLSEPTVPISRSFLSV